MSFRRGNQLDDRRRRLLSESRSDRTARTGARSGGRRSPKSEDRSTNYGDASFLDEQLRVTDLAPRRLGVLLLAFVVGVGIIVGLEILYTWMPQIAPTGPDSDGSVATIDLDSEGSLAVWFSSITLTLSAVMAVIVFSVRRHKKDDYRGAYHIWLWAACCWLMMSIDETASLHEGFKEMMTSIAGNRLHGDGSLWWVVAYAFVLGAIGTRLLLDMRECRLSAGSFLAGGGCYALAVVTQLQWIMPESGARGVMVEEGAEMLGNLFILLAMALHARFVLLDAQGLLPPVRRWTWRHEEAEIDDEYSSDEEDEEEYKDDVRDHRSRVKVHPPHGVSGPSRRSATEARLLARAAKAEAQVAQQEADEAEREEEASTPPVTRRLTKQEKKALRRRLRKQQEKRAGG